MLVYAAPSSSFGSFLHYPEHLSFYPIGQIDAGASFKIKRGDVRTDLRNEMKITWLEFVVGCLATFRMSLMLAKEEGPAEAARKVQHAVPEGWIKRGFYCECVKRSGGE